MQTIKSGRCGTGGDGVGGATMRVNKTPGRAATFEVDTENVDGVRSGDISSSDHLTF